MPVALRLTLLSALLLALPGCRSLAASGVIAQMTELHRDGNCAEMLHQAESGFSFMDDRPQLIAQATYMKADCFTRMGRKDEALELFRYVADHHPESPYAYQSKARARRLDRELSDERAREQRLGQPQDQGKSEASGGSGESGESGSDPE